MMHEENLYYGNNGNLEHDSNFDEDEEYSGIGNADHDLDLGEENVDYENNDALDHDSAFGDAPASAISMRSLTPVDGDYVEENDRTYQVVRYFHCDVWRNEYWRGKLLFQYEEGSKITF